MRTYIEIYKINPFRKNKNIDSKGTGFFSHYYNKVNTSVYWLK